MQEIFFIYEDLNNMIDEAVEKCHDIEDHIKEYFKKQDRRLK